MILAERDRSHFEFEEVNVEADDELELEYGIRVPVVTIDGVERFEVSVEPGEFAAAIR